MNPSDKLDSILEIISKKGEFIYSKEISQMLPIEISIKDLTPIIDKLVYDGYVLKKISEKENVSSLTPPFHCRITFEGSLFLENGGYRKKIKSIKLNENYTKVKTIANVLNAFLILLIAAAGVFVSLESKKKNEIIEKKDIEIEQLKIQVQKNS